MKTFDEVRPLRWSIILLALIISGALTLLINLIVFPSGLLRPIVRATGSRIQQTLVVNLAGFIVVIGGVVIGLGQLRWEDLGLRISQIWQGVQYAVAYWLAWQTLLIVVSLFESQTVRFSEAWGQRQITSIIGALMAQLCGTALKEETFFRGFLLPQVYLKLKRVAATRPGLCMGGAVLVSALVFAVMHVPALFYHRYAVPAHVARLTIAGVADALLYVYSGNLYFVIVVHALGNWNMHLFDTAIDEGLIGYCFQVLLVTGWSVLIVLQRRQNTRHTAQNIA